MLTLCRRSSTYVICFLSTFAVFAVARSAAAVGGPLTSFYDPNNQIQHVFYIDDSGGYINELYNPGGGWQWGFKGPVETTHGSGLTSPQTGAPMTSLWDGQVEHVYYIDYGTLPITTGTFGHLAELYFSGGTWWEHDLTEITSAPEPYGTRNINGFAGVPDLSISTNLASFWDGSVEHVFFVASDQQIHETYYNGAWWDHALTATTGPYIPPNLGGYGSGAGGLTVFGDGSAEHVIYLGNDGNSHELRYASGSWTTTNITGSNPNNAPWGFVTGYWDAPLNTARVFGSPLNDSYDYVELSAFAGSWSSSLAVTTFNIPIGVQCPSVSYGVNGTQHVFFVGEDLHIHELYSSGANWYINDLTLGSAGNPPLAASDWYLSPITGYWDGSLEHVFISDRTATSTSSMTMVGGTRATSSPVAPARGPLRARRRKALRRSRSDLAARLHPLERESSSALARIIHDGAEEAHGAPTHLRDAPRRLSAPPKRRSAGPAHPNEAQMGLFTAHRSPPALRRQERCARGKARAARRVMP